MLGFNSPKLRKILAKTSCRYAFSLAAFLENWDHLSFQRECWLSDAAFLNRRDSSHTPFLFSETCGLCSSQPTSLNVFSSPTQVHARGRHTAAPLSSPALTSAPTVSLSPLLTHSFCLPSCFPCHKSVLGWAGLVLFLSFFRQISALSLFP